MEAITYSSDIKTDRDKLFACYSLIEQHRLEHNKVAATARANPDKYLKTGKFRTYAHESKAKLKRLLKEQNRLRGYIKWANYTPEEWRKVSGLDMEEQNAAHEALFGNKAVEKIKTTKATSLLLDELKALNLDDMPESLGTDPTADFETFVERDEGTEITVTTTKLDFTALDTKNNEIWVYKDKTADHFNGDFEHLEKVYTTSSVVLSIWLSWCLANAAAKDYADLYNANDDFLHLMWYVPTGETTPGCYLRECVDQSITSDNTVVLANGTVRFLEIERDYGEGDPDFGDLYCFISENAYWDDAGDQVDDLSIALTQQMDLRYIYALQGYDIADAGELVTGYVELLDLQEVVVAIPRHGFVNFQDPGIL